MESSGSDRAESIADALAFRRERRRLFPGAVDNERRYEIRIGLASYTGIAAWASSPANARRGAVSALAGLAGSELPPSLLVGKFEAASGPAHGVLLDDLAPGSRRQLRSTSDPGDLLASATSKPTTTDLGVAAAPTMAQQVRVAELR
jgi:hypothetical protein